MVDYCVYKVRDRLASSLQVPDSAKVQSNNQIFPAVEIFHSKFCRSQTSNMQIIAALALAATAIAAPTAQSQCLKAAKDLAFQIRDFTFNSRAIYSTPAHLATSEGTVKFDFAVSAKKAPIQCSATSVGTYPAYFQGDTWYACEATDTFSAKFKYDLETGLVTLKAHWNCPE